jgi:predicted MPP superfamily phosphohydrolase
MKFLPEKMIGRLMCVGAVLTSSVSSTPTAGAVGGELMRHFSRRVNRVTIYFLLLFAANCGWCGRIVYPWRATTSIVKSGESFEVWFDADAGQSVSSAILQGPFHDVPVSITATSGRWEYDAASHNAYNNRITLEVPRSAPAGRYDVVLVTSSGRVVSPAAVKVIKDYKSSYYILHFSDVHAFQNGYETTLARLSTIVDIANLINPELVFNTGDNLYRPTADRMNQLFAGDASRDTKGLNSLNAATFTVAGNHDIDFDHVPNRGYYREKADWWNKWWGLQAYSFSYGSGRFMVINNGWEGFDPGRQIEAAGSWLQAAGAGNFRLGAAHIRNQEMAALDRVANLDLVLVGHNHHIANQNPALLANKPIQYIANSVRDHMEFNLFKVDARSGTYAPVSGPTAQVVYVENPEDAKSPHLYRPKLTLSFAKANDGSFATNVATIVNKFGFPIEGAKVRFVMPLGGAYSVSQGQVEQSFNGPLVQVVDLLVDLESNSTNIVTISPKK